MKNAMKLFRTMRRISQETLAEKVGVTRQTIIAIENEKYDPSLDLAFKIADVFGVSVEDVFFPEGRTQNKSGIEAFLEKYGY